MTAAYSDLFEDMEFYYQKRTWNAYFLSLLPPGEMEREVAQ